MIFNKRKKNKKERGFSLVEALISITVLMISVAAPLKLAGDGVNSASIAEQQIVAFYLTQDAMEYVKNVKTSNRLALDDITEGLDDCNVTVGHGCRIDTVEGSTFPCSAEDCATSGLLRFHDGTGVYDYDNTGSVDSIFTRQIKVITKRLNPATSAVLEMQVEVSTRWTSYNGQTQEYKLKANLLDW